MEKKIDVTIKVKSKDHPNYNRGYPIGYVINGVEGSSISLKRGETYVLDIRALDHPFYFTTSEVGGHGMPNSLMGDTTLVDRGTLVWTVPNTVPDTFYYQCARHEYMGGIVTVENSHHTIIVEEEYAELVSPTNIVGAGNTMYIAEQTGQIYVTTKDGIEQLLDLSSEIPKLKPEYDERGLLGLAIAVDGRFYVFYTIKGGKQTTNRISRINIDSMEEETLLEITHREDKHNGGRLAFSPVDGCLYISVGDGQQEETAQDLSLLLGKILRIDVSGEEGYLIPEDNPYTNRADIRSEIYAYGFRNPWSMTFADDGTLFVADVGEDTIEKVVIVENGGNYGWNYMEGTKIRKRGGKDIIAPIYEYTHDMNKQLNAKHSDQCAIIGGYYLPEWGYIYGDYSGYVARIVEEDGTWHFVESTLVDGYVKAFGRVDNTIYLMTSSKAGPNSNTGKIHKVKVV